MGSKFGKGLILIGYQEAKYFKKGMNYVLNNLKKIKLNQRFVLVSPKGNFVFKRIKK